MSKQIFNEKTDAELEAAKKQLEGDPNYKAPAEEVEGGSATIPLAEEEDENTYVRPEKFQSEEELVKAYLELEKKLATKPKEEAKETPTEEEVEEAVAKGVDFEEITNEFYSNGELSDETYMSLAKKGYSKDVVDTYINGHKAKEEAQLRDIYETAGGKDMFETAVAWAQESWDASRIKAFNTIIESGDNEAIAFAVESLMEKATKGMTQSPNLMAASPNTTSTRGVFRSMQEYIDAIRDPRYKRDPGYRKELDEKLVRSNL